MITKPGVVQSESLSAAIRCASFCGLLREGISHTPRCGSALHVIWRSIGGTGCG
jgi:hypothetical protein